MKFSLLAGTPHVLAAERASESALFVGKQSNPSFRFTQTISLTAEFNTQGNEKMRATFFHGEFVYGLCQNKVM
jgi:hypothetical protein